ncbi:VCBS domain-containing protein [Halomonas huangheensis]|uniref:DUF4347 domain-containing protein n=1 Tax=Halomonas huangheensis TaxID=1178482 RepID=W1NAW3_9GAMM|nr:VCBS domain-containing protein [Halomonas huangheensis]ALM52439.1 hypothetical protein AR456_09210 [Halomonas huangheensis]ERL52638.1 hypothetical protein BJB45_18845 [Halomonas huangheensis]
MKGIRPRSRLVALEPRLLFDGAAAAAVDQDHGSDDNQQDGDRHVEANTASEAKTADNANRAQKHLVVVDARLDPAQRQTIIDNTSPDAALLVVDAGDNGIDSITSALAGMDGVQSVEIFSHGAEGQFQLGTSYVSGDTLPQLEQQLGQWRDALTADADLLLYGCQVGDGTTGQQLVDSLADATGADVAASNDDTGEARFGGDWQLETTRGDIDQQTGTDLDGLATMNGLLPAAPTVSLGATSQEVPLGESFEFTVSFSNTSTEVGYAPFIHLYVPTTGKDGAGAEIDDGITVTSANYVGGDLPITTITFDDNGQAEHPVAKDSNGNAVIINAADYGYRPGDTLVVVEIPFASFGPDQPAIDVTFTATLSDLADTSATDGSPNLDITAIGGFELGHDSLDNPQDDPSIIGTNPAVITVTPTVIEVDQTLNMTEDETATGENYTHSLTTTIRPAGIDPNTQALTNVVITQPVPTNVQVTNIDPGNGTLTSITLASGQVVTNPGVIETMINRDDVFITEYTVEYATLTGAESSTIEFYVPEQDADGNPILDPDTGDDVTITFDAPTGSGDWDPIDDRDEPDGGGTVDFSGTGEPISFTAKSIALHKTATIITDTGTTGLTPGDTLEYQLEMTLSDYFAFGNDTQDQGQFLITDTVSNGQTVEGTPTMTVSFSDRDGNTQQNVTVDLVYTETDNGDGTTTLVFDIAASMQQAFPDQPWLAGDASLDNTIDGTATRASIAYTTTIDDEYATDVDHPALNEGDSVSNSAEVSADILIDENNTTGFDESDNSNTETTVPTSNVDIEIPSGDTELSPGEEVTFTVSYELITGDHENFQLIVYLPLPLLDTSGIDWSEGDGPGTWAINAANTHEGEITNVESGPGNSLIFTFADLDAADPSTIAIDFTMTVGDQPFADQRSLDVLAQSRQTTTIEQTLLVSEDVVRVQSVAEPVVDITHGVVSSDNGTVTGTDGNWADPGSTGDPHTGAVTDPSVGDGNVSDIDAGDTLRLATILKNSGGGGAYDVTTTVDLPDDLTFVGDSLDAANLILSRGDGTVLTEGTDYEVNGNTITLLDADNTATLLAGREGTANDTSGLNVIVITYDVQVVAAVAASRTMGSTATLTNYASVNDGEDFTPNDLSDDANQQVAAPEVSIGFADGGISEDDSSEGHTTGTNLVVGESMDYDIVVTLPEGSTQELNINDLLPPGMSVDTTFNTDQGYELILSQAGSGALGADFAGDVTVGSFDPATGTIIFSSSVANADNDITNNSFVIRLRLIADNVQGNQQGTAQANDVELSYSDPDGDEVNGDTAVIRDVSHDDANPTITIVEPTVTIDQALTVPVDPGFGIDEGDAVEFTITLDNSSGTDAFDLSVLADLPAQLEGLDIVSVSGSAADGDFQIIDGQLVSMDGANIDLADGENIVITISGTVTADAPDAVNLISDASVQWTSLNDEVTTSAGTERTGVDGELNSGVLNDYQTSNVLEIPVAAAIQLSRIGGLDDTNAADPTDGPSEDVAVGEIIRYRATVLIPEGDLDNYELRVTLPDGLSFIDDPSTITLALISDSGIGTSIGLGGEQVSGNEDSDQAQLISGDNWLTEAIAAGIVTFDGQDVVFSLGNLSNTDGNDADLEGFSIEFNVRVNNIDTNQAGQQLAVTASDSVNGQARSESETLTETIVEPGFTGLDKSVVDFDPGVGNATGNATVDISFSQNGTAPAYDVTLTDAFPDGSNYTVNTITIGGDSYAPDSLPPGVTLTTDADGISLAFEQLNPDTEVTVNYSVDVPNDAVVAEADAQATLTWSSLPEDFAGYGDSAVGADGTADGERDSSDGSGGLNDYILSEGAGLGIIEGTLWDDTNNANGSQDAGEAGFTDRTVTLAWAGNDGVFGNDDDGEFTIQTGADGSYQFGVLPTGLYRIIADNEFTDADADEVRARYDTDGGTYGDGSLADISVNLAEGATGPANIGYVQLNEAPVNEGVDSATATGDEDTVIDIDGLSISDPDARDPASQAGANNHQVVLEVTQGTLDITDVGDATVTGSGTATLTITGSVAQINAALDSLTYQGNLNFNGEDTLTITTSDQGNFGDHPDASEGNGIPGETADALTDVDSLTITVNAVNDDPVANDDTGIAVEAGGTDNNQVGVDPNGFLLNNDTDVDIATNGDVLTVTQVGVDADSLQLVDGDPSVPTEIAGLYGTLIVGSDGFAQYIVDNDNPDVQALRLSSDTLQENFVYEIADLEGVTAQAAISVTIQGANDTPIAEDDTGTAIEAGGVNNATGGQNANGNVLDNDTDVDAFDETKVVNGIRSGDEDATGPFFNVSTGTTSGDGTSIVGQYGTLTMGADGSYEYVIDNDNVDVQRLTNGESLSETFSYAVVDAGGLLDIANLTITIDGNQDNPLATDNTTDAQAPSTDGSTPAVNGSGNLISDDDGDGVDEDVDAIDRPNTNLTVNGIRTGTEDAGGALTDVAASTDVIGTYGTLTVNPDGSYEYVVDGDNADVQALAAGETISETFTYQLVDTADNTDLAQLVVTITGANDPPVPVDDTATAIEAGGIDNGTAGVDPTGNVLDNDTDIDGQPLEVSEFAQDTTTATAGSSLTGSYGTLTINADGSYSYVLDNDNPDVQALRTSGDQLNEVFTYTALDPLGAETSASLTITIEGRNDTPEATDDTATAVEAGGVDNTIPGTDPSGNVLDNDTDVDGADYGETQTVVSVSQGGNSAPAGQTLQGQYGSLVINDDGSYQYDVDNDNPAVEALRTAGQTLTENFDYIISDTDGDTASAVLTITIQGANDTPIANDDDTTAVEAGGIDNGTAGVDPSGNVLDNDTDIDGIDYGETKTVVSVSQGANSALAGQTIQGQYGTLVINDDGSYQYTVDNDNPTVQALRTAGETLTESFDYEMRDTAGDTSTALLTIVIQGANDTPVAENDTATAVEAGGIDNATPGTDPAGNVLDNDTDVDDGDTKAVNGIRTGSEAAGGDFTGVSGSTEIAGQYGTLTINADGSFTYAIDNSLDAVQQLVEGESLTETFSYRMLDTIGATDVAQLTLTIEGAWDAPVADNDLAYAVAENPNGTGSNPDGNVLDNDTDVDGNDSLSVGAVRAGQESAGGPLLAVPPGGLSLAGQYGMLTINPDGSYLYEVDNTNPTVIALDATDFLNDYFTYEAVDQGGLVDTAQLRVIIRGGNDTPIAGDDTGSAIEAGGLDNASPGENATGNVLDNDEDPDDDVGPAPGGPNLEVISIRTGSADGTGTAGTVGEYLEGEYGRLILGSDGEYIYEVDDSNPEVQALRQSGQTLMDVFTYTMDDRWGAEASAELSITIDGRNDTPTANDDDAVAVEAGGINNGTAGTDPTGNVLDNDTDVDGVDYGETKTVVSVSQGGSSALAGQTFQGRYGTLLINDDGSYQYEVDNDNPTVQALRTAGQTLTERFDYVMRDTAGDTSTARLTIVIQGANDTPVANDDTATAVEAGGSDNSTPGTDPTGNVLDNDSDVDGPNRGETTTVIDVSQGASSVQPGQNLTGQYGTLVLNADGSYRYEVDNDNPDVQALRTAGQTLTENFNYIISDTAGDTTSAVLSILIQGANDTPIANDDGTTAVEAGGIDNGTPGVDPTGNVLDNDTDVDGTEYGESKTVVSFRQGDNTAGAGQTLQGRYGTLIINADGSYRYEVNNDDPTVQALRTAGETLTERFDYVMRDTAGDTSSARLTIVLEGANDNPVARDDSNVASDQTPAPQATGNVLPNDSDVDGGDSREVIDVRPIDDDAVTAAGQSLDGRYGTLILNTDGSYEYVIDMSNSEVLQAAGRGAILQDVFVYRIGDLAGAPATANLTISLDIAAPYIPTAGDADPYYQGSSPLGSRPGLNLGFEPIVYITPEVELNNIEITNYLRLSDSGNPWLVRPLEPMTLVGADLGKVGGQFVGQMVAVSQAFHEQDQLILLGRHGRTSLSADGLLPDPSIEAATRSTMLEGFRPNEDAGVDDGPATASNTDDRQALPTDGAVRTEQQQADNADIPEWSTVEEVEPPVALGFRQQLQTSNLRIAPLTLESDS